MAGPAPLRPIRDAAERDIIARYAKGEDIDTIVAATGIKRDRVADLITGVAGFDRGRATAAVRAFDAPKAPAAPPAAPVDTIEQLLTQAEQSGVAKTARLASRIRGQLHDLNTLMKASEKERQLRATLAVLREHMDKTHAELKSLKGKPTAAKPAAANGKADGKTIRAWAKENSVACPPVGKIPTAVRETYEKATAS